MLSADDLVRGEIEMTEVQFLAVGDRDHGVE